MTKKKLGIVGWWGGKNEGDDYIKHCLMKAFGKDFRIRLIETPFNVTKWNLMQINRLDYLIVGGGGLFTLRPPAPFDAFDQWGHRLNVPFGFLGVGVQEIGRDYRHVIKEIIERASFFVVRDESSLDVVKSFSTKATKCPDISFLYPRRIQRTPTKGTIGINMRVWNFDENRTYDNQAWCKVINDLPGNRKTMPLSFLDSVDDREAMKCVDGMKNDKFQIDLYRDIEIMAGMRLHSLIFAAQNSIPIIGISYTPKIKRFFHEIGLEELCLEVNEYERLKDTYHVALERNEELSDRLNKYTINAQQAVTKCVGEIKNEIL